MKTRVRSPARLAAAALALTAGLAPPAPAAAADVATFGAPLQGLPPASLEQLLAHPEAGRRVRLEGRVEKVCQNKGCWLSLRQGTRSIHVTFAGYAFFVPKDSASRQVALEGKLVVKTPKPEEVAHLEAEGAGQAAAAGVSIEATGVELR